MTNFEVEGGFSKPVNILAERYATPEMAELFSPEAQVVLERGLWIAVMEEQMARGATVDISQGDIDDYKAVQAKVDLASINAREKKTRHDVKARVEEFNDLAGHELVHSGMTSRDATENVEQMQIRIGMELIQLRSAAVLGQFAMLAAENSDLVIAGRSHNVAAQATTLGKRFATWGEEHMRWHEALGDFLESYQLRGIKGPVGTQQDMLDLFAGDQDKVDGFEGAIAKRLGFEGAMNSVGQVYPRSFDSELVHRLHMLGKGPANFATTLRLMAGQELATEGFKKGQVGSSAMPHKMNARTSERINGFDVVMSGYQVMADRNSGVQWNEGDVSCSVVRRDVISNSFFATDGMLAAVSDVQKNFGAYPAVIQKEFDRYAPFLATTKALMAAIEAGQGREEAHEIIKEHATAVVLEMREDGRTENDLFERLAQDERLKVDAKTLEEAISNPISMTGNAEAQVAKFVERAEEVVAKTPGAKDFAGGEVI